MTAQYETLTTTARQMVAPGKGILAADESNGTMTKRLEGVGAESTPESRLRFRELLFTTPGVEEHISGVILYDETLRQRTPAGIAVPDLLAGRGILPGIKVDTGAMALAGSPGETVTEGLDGLRDRLAEYRELGARFAKWRAVIAVDDDGLPSANCIRVNAHALGRYAALCQEAGIVPIVEPEVLMDGTHTIDRSEEITATTLRAVFAELLDQGVLLEGIVLKPNMVLAGYDCPVQASVDDVGERTLATLRRAVPAAVPGIAFLSGGQSDEAACAHLSAMSAAGGPWELTFSYGRALQAAALRAWGGEESNAEAAQSVLAHRVRCNGQARMGRYSSELELAAAA